MPWSPGRSPRIKLTKRSRYLTAAAALVLLLVLLGVALSRHGVRRVAVFPPLPRPPASAPGTVIAELSPVEEWTRQFRDLAITGRWGELHELLGRIETAHPNEYAKWHLAYLDARTLLADDKPRNAARDLAPFLTPGDALRDLALFHQP